MWVEAKTKLRGKTHIINSSKEGVLKFVSIASNFRKVEVEVEVARNEAILRHEADCFARLATASEERSNQSKVELLETRNCDENFREGNPWFSLQLIFDLEKIVSILYNYCIII